MDDTTDPHVCPSCGADAAKLRILADFLDVHDENHEVSTGEPMGDDVQRDLRRWATQAEGVAQ